MLEVNVHQRDGKQGRVHWQYDFRVTLPDGSIYRERRKARGATSESAARRIGETRMREVLRAGPSGKKAVPVAELPTPTVAEFAVEWLDICRTERQSPITVAHKEIMLRRHLLPVVGELRLDEITEQKITLLRKRLADMKSSTVNLVVKTFQTMLRRARKLGYRATVPEVKLLPEQRQRNWYTPEDYERLVAVAATFDVVSLVIVLLGGDAGLRAGEMLGLRWEDLDFTHRTLYVRRNLVMGQERAPKWGTARDIPLSDRLKDALLLAAAPNPGRRPRPGAQVEQRRTDDDEPHPAAARARSPLRRRPPLRPARPPPQLRHPADAQRRQRPRGDGTSGP
ncbi:MAG: tyrosine-type recombinase/integrase [Myxococcales bacterium]|nr:tyrosine-type recombinase/integrase [Myxococcales bacterium]